MKMFDDNGRAPKCSKCKQITYAYGYTDDDKVLCIKCLGFQINMECELCKIPMEVWNFTSKVWHCYVCGNIIIEDIE